MLNRSWLYVPGDAPDKLEGATKRGADALILDLEDAVAPAAKAAARDRVADWLAGRSGHDDDGRWPEVWVRVNAEGRWQEDDLAALVGQPIDGIVVPKASVRAIQEVREAVDAGAAAPAPRIAGLVEDARGLVDAVALAATPGLSHLGMGEADLRADLHVDPSDDERELDPIRLAVVVACAAAGIRAPVGATSTDYRDLDALRRSTDRLRRLGFVGRTAIHPRQVAVVNEVFTPGEDDVARARAVVARFEEAIGDGRGVVTDADGRMVDEAVVRGARRTLALAATSAAARPTG